MEEDNFKIKLVDGPDFSKYESFTNINSKKSNK